MDSTKSEKREDCIEEQSSRQASEPTRPAAAESGLRRSTERHAPTSPKSVAMGTGDIIAVLAVAVSTVLVMVAEPTDRWFLPSQSLESCVCTGTGETLLCPCIPVIFLIFEGWMATMFTSAFVLIFRTVIRHKEWCTAAFYISFDVPAFGWSVYQAVPPQFRIMVMYLDSGLFAITSIVMYFILRWRARTCCGLPL